VLTVGYTVVPTVEFDGDNNGDPIRLNVGVGGPDYLDGWWSTAAIYEYAGLTAHGYRLGFTQVQLNPSLVSGASGALLAQFSWSSAPTHGSVDIYALIAEPTA
jgi:hypothetical protein